MPGKVVLISYSHDSVEHREKVLQLAARLRQDGLDAQLDQYVNGTPEQGWPRWMLDQLDEAGFVLVVCTESYYRRFRGHEVLDQGKGVTWEGALITQELYDAQSRMVKFVPVMLEAGQERFIPEPLRGHTHYELISEERYQALYGFLQGQAGVEPGPLGATRPIPRRVAQPLTFDPVPEQQFQIQGTSALAPMAIHGLHGIIKTQAWRGLVQPATEVVLLNRLVGAHRARRRVVFLVGAGLTLPPTVGKPGVPGAEDMVRRVTDRLKESGAKPPESVGNSELLGYQEALELYRLHRGQRGLDELVREAVLEACVDGDPKEVAAARAGDLEACRRLERAPAAWVLPPGVEALGRLIAACPDTFGTAVFTTNFDPLVEVAIRRAGGQSHTTFLAEDGRFSVRHGDGCHVIHVHGLWSGEGYTAHTMAQLSRPRPQLRRDLERFLERSDLVVLGYGGWQDVFSEVITSILIDPTQGTEVLWCFYEKSWEEIEARYSANLERLAPGLATVVVPYNGIDANEFLPQLSRELIRPRGHSKEDRLSPYIAGPPIYYDADFFGRRQQREQIAGALIRCQPVQLLGERRMGKTSLLRWVERHAEAYRPGWPVAWVDAGALADRSPAALVRAIGESIGAREEVSEHLRRAGEESTERASGAAGEVLESLLPLVLLVDEAAALAAPGHRFNACFLGLLRAAGQAQRLAWISTSDADLRALFQQDRLTSPFLNDSLRLPLGELEKEAAGALLDRGLEPDQAVVALAQAGRLPYLLQWIADALFRGKLPESAADALREELEPDYDGWWRSAEDEEKRLLGMCVEGMPLAGLAPPDRRRLRRLVDRGLAVEEEGRFTLPGAAWRDFVAERRNG